MIVKPHPAQDLAHIRALELSNLRFIDDGLFAAHGITSYEFLACTDALITDYSSVLFDYLLTGKPVGLTFEDIDAYARQPGFAIDPQPLRESAAMLDTPDDFRTFCPACIGRRSAAGQAPAAHKADQSIHRRTLRRARRRVSGRAPPGKGAHMRRVITYGTFDLLHYGHINLLRRAKEQGDYLIVALSTDEFNWEQKQKKSYFSYEDRKRMLEAIRYVDLVIPEESWDQKITDVDKYHVDVFVMGDDWKGKFDFLKDKCEVVYLPRTPEISTTKIKTDLHT